MADIEELDRAQREVWRRGAAGWARRQRAMREKTAPLTDAMLAALDPQPGERLLELAAGPGDTGLLAAARVAPDGSLLSTDQSPEMIAIARRRAQELGLGNVEFAEVDAQRLELEPGRFDGVLCRFGYMLMADPDEALRRTRRVLRDGGRLVMATWDAPDRNLWMAAPVVQLVTRGAMELPPPGSPSPFAMPDPAALETRLRDAGFSSAHAEKFGFTQTWASLDDYWAETIDLAAPIAAILTGLDDDARAAVRDGAFEMLGPFVADDGSLAVPASTVLAVASA
jgi:ubiquinone/menaquinone biosynthesis C-methylase UbiE